MIEAIEKSNGILAQAAKLLNCSRQTVYNYIEKYATVKAAYEEANETTIDFVESKLLEQIKAGNSRLIEFYLKTKAKHRGYTERQEHTGPDGGDLTIKVVYEDALGSND